MTFDLSLCRNESEVESKLIVQYLLPNLGYSSDQIKDSEQVVINNLNALKAVILNEINSKIPKPIPLLDAFNQILDDRVCELVLKEMSFFEKKKAQKIVNQLRDKRKQIILNSKPSKMF